jgi:putative transposase
MTKQEFLQLQSDHLQSGLSLKSYLRQIGTGYSTYNYWRKKYSIAEHQHHDLAPIRFRQSSSSSSPVSFTGDVPSGATLLFPNGLRAHLGIGTEDVLRDLLDKSLSSHVLPE